MGDESRLNKVTVVVDFEGTSDNFKQGVWRSLGFKKLIDTEFQRDANYTNTVDLRRTIVHSIEAKNITAPHMTDDMNLRVVAAEMSPNTNDHLNKTTLCDSDLSVLYAMYPCEKSESHEKVYEQAEKLAKSTVRSFQTAKLRDPKHVTHLDEEQAVIIVTDEAVKLLESGLEAVHNDRFPEDPNPPQFSLWSLPRRTSRPELPKNRFDQIVELMDKMNAKSEECITDFSKGLGLTMQWNSVTPKTFSGTKKFQISLKIAHTPPLA